MKFDDLVREHLGEFGRYQKCLFLLVCFPCIVAAMHALSWTFSAANLPHRCRLEFETNDATYWLPSNLSTELTFSHSNCPSNKTQKNSFEDQCFYRMCYSNGSKNCPHGFVYNFEQIRNSAINRWNIVCDRHFLKAVIQFTYYIGQLIGALVFGSMGDRVGRKKIVFTAMLIEIVCGFLLAFSPHWTLFAIARMGVGMAHPAITTTCIVIGHELVGPFGRRYGTLLSGGFFSIGHMLLAVLAYFIRDYMYLQLILAIPAILFLFYWWILPESPRWLVSQRRYREADKILRKAAQINKTTIPDDWWHQIENKIENKKMVKYTLIDLFKTPKLRCHTLSAFFVWPVVSMVYYGLSMNTNFLGGNLYLTFFLGAAVDTPANIRSYPISGFVLSLNEQSDFRFLFRGCN